MSEMTTQSKFNVGPAAGVHAAPDSKNPVLLQAGVHGSYALDPRLAMEGSLLFGQTTQSEVRLGDEVWTDSYRVLYQVNLSVNIAWWRTRWGTFRTPIGGTVRRDMVHDDVARQTITSTGSVAGLQWELPIDPLVAFTSSAALLNGPEALGDVAPHFDFMFSARF